MMKELRISEKKLAQMAFDLSRNYTTAVLLTRWEVKRRWREMMKAE